MQLSSEIVIFSLGDCLQKNIDNSEEFELVNFLKLAGKTRNLRADNI